MDSENVAKPPPAANIHACAAKELKLVLQQANEVREYISSTRQDVDDVWCYLEDACQPAEHRTFTLEACRDSGRDAVFKILQGIRAAERELDELVDAVRDLDRAETVR